MSRRPPIHMPPRLAESSSRPISGPRVIVAAGSPARGCRARRPRSWWCSPSLPCSTSTPPYVLRLLLLSLRAVLPRPFFSPLTVPSHPASQPPSAAAAYPPAPRPGWLVLPPPYTLHSMYRTVYRHSSLLAATLCIDPRYPRCCRSRCRLSGSTCRRPGARALSTAWQPPSIRSAGLSSSRSMATSPTATPRRCACHAARARSPPTATTTTRHQSPGGVLSSLRSHFALARCG
jgi:hypothetical protein